MYEREEGERLVAAAKPRYKDFRVDFEKISTAASKAAREARNGLDPASALGWFNDVDWHLRTPLQRRYAAEGAFEVIAHYHAKRFKLLLGRNEPWPDAPCEDAMRLFAAHDRADIGVALIRGYVDMQHKRLKSDFSTRNPRPSRKQRSEGVECAIANIGKMIAAAIPDQKADLLRNMDSVAPYLATHASAEDNDWFEQVQREIWMEKRA